MDAHGESLMDDERLTPVYSLVKLQRLNERISELHKNKELTEDPHLNSLNAELNVQIFMNELQEWRGSIPDEMSTLRRYSTMFHVPVLIHGM